MTTQADRKYTSALVSSVYSSEEDSTAFEDRRRPDRRRPDSISDGVLTNPFQRAQNASKLSYVGVTFPLNIPVYVCKCMCSWNM